MPVMPCPSRPSRLRTLGLSVPVVLVVLLLVTVLAGRWRWGWGVAPSHTIQQALAASLRDPHQQLCHASSPSALATIWVVTGPTYGMAVLVADCQNDPEDTRQALVFVELGVDTPDQPRCPDWQVLGSAFALRPPPDPPTDVLEPVPAWLPLPPDHYIGYATSEGPQHRPSRCGIR